MSCMKAALRHHGNFIVLICPCASHCECVGDVVHGHIILLGIGVKLKSVIIILAQRSKLSTLSVINQLNKVLPHFACEHLVAL